METIIKLLGIYSGNMHKVSKTFNAHKSSLKKKKQGGIFFKRLCDMMVGAGGSTTG